MQEAAEGYECFVAVVDAGSITDAARVLGLPRETLSRRLQRLEDRLGVRLLHRSTRSLSLTTAGQTLYDRARPLVVAAREAEAAVRQGDDVPRGLLRVTVPPASRVDYWGELLLTFARRWPEVSMEVVAGSQHFDLVSQGFDVAVRAGVVRDPGLVCRRLRTVDLRAVASKAYLDRMGRPHTTEELSSHALLLGMDGEGRVTRTWPQLDGGTVEVRGRFSANDLALLLRAVREGDGIALLPARFVAADIASGALEHVLPCSIGAEASLTVVFVERQLMPAKVRAFVDHVVDWFAQHPDRF